MSNKVKKGQQAVIHPKRSNFECELDEDAVTVENNGKVWELSMDARCFLPEEINIRITKTHVVIDGFHETDEEISECNEEIVIPQDILPSTIECLLNANGVLRIRGPFQAKEVDLPAIETKSTVTTVTESSKIRTKTISETSEEVVIVEAKQLDPSTEARILQDRKFVDSTKDIQTKDGKLEMNIDVRGLKEEDIKVSVSKRLVAIQIVNKEDRTKEIHKKFLIPDGVDPSSFKSLLKKGVLTVSVDDPAIKPKPKPAAPPPKEPVPPPKPQEPVKLASQIVEPREVEQLERRCEDITKQVVTIKDKKFEANVNVSGFKAEELRMKVTKKVIIVHTETRSMTRQFNKKITIPSGVRPELIVNNLTPDNGILTITAPIVEEPPTPPTQNLDLAPKMELTNTSTVTESHFEDISKQIQTTTGRKFEVELDVSGYKPEEIEIKILKTVVTIRGTKTVQQDRQSSSQQFFKKFNIPQGVKAETIKCTFTNRGTLHMYSTETTEEKATPQLQQPTTGSGIIKPEILGGGMGSTQVATGSGEIVKFERKVDATGYKEDEIKITIANGWITITGKQQMGPELNFQSRQFTKKFSIPYGVRPDAINCCLQPNGTLVISSG